MIENLSGAEKTLRVAGVVNDSVVDGKGIRFTIFTQGCPHRCEGCHNPQTHDYEGGREMTVGELAEMVKTNPLLDGITLSGGEPFVFAGALASLARFVHERGMNVWCYTGYTLEELERLSETDGAAADLLNETDVLVDGRFEQAKLDLMLKFRGSANQRVIDMKKTRQAGQVVLL